MTADRGVVMAERAAGFWARHTVQVATRVLPGATRDRYRQEFLAELYGLGRARQLRHAFGVLSRCWALRAAINTPSDAAAADMELVFPRHRRPLLCLLNRHRWETFRTEDGKPYLNCQRCGKDETDVWAGNKSEPKFDADAPRRAANRLFFGSDGGPP
jgi:hypothetical protein